MQGPESAGERNFNLSLARGQEYSYLQTLLRPLSDKGHFHHNCHMQNGKKYILQGQSP